MSDPDPTDIESQEHVKAEHAKTVRQRRRDVDDEFTWVMSRKLGRRFMLRLMGECCMFRATNSQSLASLARDDGKREVGQHMRDVIQATCPELYITMLNEQLKSNRSADDDGRNHN